MRDWKDLTQLSSGAKLVVERVRLVEKDIAIEGQFSPPPLAQLCHEDQIFVGAFLKSHGSIKEMERLFGISYPTVKNRLNRISNDLGLELCADTNPSPTPHEILDKLEKGEITARQATEALKK